MGMESLVFASVPLEEFPFHSAASQIPTSRFSGPILSHGQFLSSRCLLVWRNRCATFCFREGYDTRTHPLIRKRLTPPAMPLGRATKSRIRQSSYDWKRVGRMARHPNRGSGAVLITLVDALPLPDLAVAWHGHINDHFEL